MLVRGWSALGQREAASAQLQVWSRPPGAGAGHHWYLYTAPTSPPPVIWPPDHCSPPPPFSVPTILRFCLFARTKIEVVQRIVTADSSSCKWCRRRLAMLRRFVPPDKRLKRDHLPPKGSTVAPRPWGANMFQSFPFPTNCPLWVELWSFLGFTRTGGQVVAGHLLSPFIVGLKQFALTRLDDIHLTQTCSLVTEVDQLKTFDLSCPAKN